MISIVAVTEGQCSNCSARATIRLRVGAQSINFCDDCRRITARDLRDARLGRR